MKYLYENDYQDYKYGGFKYDQERIKLGQPGDSTLFAQKYWNEISPRQITLYLSDFCCCCAPIDERVQAIIFVLFVIRSQTMLSGIIFLDFPCYYCSYYLWYHSFGYDEDVYYDYDNLDHQKYYGGYNEDVLLIKSML